MNRSAGLKIGFNDIAACMIIHILLAATGLDPVLHELGESLGIDPGVPHAH
ncbi:MAG: hypothetical protein K9G62_06175 [Alphaproteobacteria bacterium]|nr:hypothetical protein [Alphaproteobacteria bacterium]